MPIATAIEQKLNRIIHRALANAQSAGKDHLTQTERTVRAVLQARPDMTASDALTQVNRVRGSYCCARQLLLSLAAN